MAWSYTNLDTFRGDVSAASASVRNAQWTAAMAEWQLSGMFRMPEFEENELLTGFYTYQPKTKLYIAGDPSPATCESDPSKVKRSTGDPISVKLFCRELAYDVCHKDKCTQTLETYIAESEFDVAVALGGVLFTDMWEGDAALGTYGIFTHPLTSVTPTAAPENPVVGQTNFQSKTANEVIGEIRDAMRGMRNPNLAISEQAWSDIADKILGDGNNCNRAGDCILQKLVQSEVTGTFSGTLNGDFFIRKYFDDVEIGGVPTNGIYVVWDEDAVEIPTDNPRFMSPMPQKKRVDMVRDICSAGAIVKYTDSVRVVTGINEVIA